MFTPTCNPTNPVSHVVVPCATPDAPVVDPGVARQLIDLIPAGCDAVPLTSVDNEAVVKAGSDGDVI